MKFSTSFTKTSKQAPSDESSNNAQLLIKAGFIHKTMAGVYAYLPLGLRVLNKIEGIIRDNINSIGGQEILMNSLHPQELWAKTNRWDSVDVLFKLDSQTGSPYALAPTHEEQITPLLKSYISSYKDLPEYIEGTQMPLAVYQIQTKFRDELRAKAGLMRGREFRMKDLYDVHTTKESQERYFELVTKTYHTIYNQLGLKSYAVDASGGSFSDKFSREFQVQCDAGEDITYVVPDTDIAYNEEVAPSKAPVYQYGTDNKVKEDILLDGIVGVESLCRALEIEPERTTKTLFYETENGEMIAAVVRGTHSINEEKLVKVVQKGPLKLASSSLVMQKTGASVGYAGLVNLPDDIKVYCDDSLENAHNFETGTNKDGYHSINVQFGRDIQKPKTFYDIKTVQKGDLNPQTGKEYHSFVSAEVGNIFDLGQKWIKAFDVSYMDQNNTKQYPFMGCHGIGSSRCMGVIAELYSDEKGLKWPESVAPFTYHIITHLDKKDDIVNESILNIAQKLYKGELKVYQNDKHVWKLIDPQNIDDISQFTFEEIEHMNSGDDILWDDRKSVSIGEKFKDAELIGCPFQIVITPRTIRSGELIEVKDR